MEIVGLGSNLVECAKIAQLLAKFGENFLERYFTPREIRECQAKTNVTEHFAARWAAKEAVLQALSLKAGRHTVWTDVEVRRSKGEWKVYLGGAIKDRVRELRVTQLRVTLSQTRLMAVAFALAIARKP